jgi:hypothetical protein
MLSNRALHNHSNIMDNNAVNVYVHIPVSPWAGDVQIHIVLGLRECRRCRIDVQRFQLA